MIDIPIPSIDVVCVSVNNTLRKKNQKLQGLTSDSVVAHHLVSNSHVLYRENLNPGIETISPGVASCLVVFFKPKSMTIVICSQHNGI